MTEYKTRSWYGLPVTIDVERGFLHHVRVAGIPMDHPALVNLVLRRNLPKEERIALSRMHEIGHLQTLPLALVHMVWLAPDLNRRGWKISLILSAWIAHQALWEAMTELYVMLNTCQEYRQIYRDNPNKLGLSLFWSGVSALSMLFSRKVVND